MLNQGKIKFLIVGVILLQACFNKVSSKKEQDTSLKISGKSEYFKIYQNASDSIETWSENQLGLYTFKKEKFEYQLDSLLCFNKNFDRMVTCILGQIIIKPSSSDGIIFFYGEKINEKWYFFRGASIVLLRNLYQKDNAPLSFEKLHEIALGEVYKGYLTPEGEINEAWFTSHFEGPGWCNCKTRAEYEKVHLEKVNNNWYQRDATKKEVLP